MEDFVKVAATPPSSLPSDCPFDGRSSKTYKLKPVIFAVRLSNCVWPVILNKFHCFDACLCVIVLVDGILLTLFNIRRALL